MAAAHAQLSQAFAEQVSNGDETLYATKIGNFSKSLPHNDLGEVDLDAYSTFTRAVSTGDSVDFERIARGGSVTLTNPQGGLAHLLEGADPQQIAAPPSPAFASKEQAAEIAELYWMAVARDVPFIEYGSDPIIRDAAEDLSGLGGYGGAKYDGEVTPDTVFRVDIPGLLAGPFVSQFLVQEALFGAERVDRRIRTQIPANDFLTSYGEWLSIQNGEPAGVAIYDDTRRYIRSARDLAEWVHRDVLFQGAFDALLVLGATGAPLDPSNPYNDLAVYEGEVVGRIARNQHAFTTLGDPYIASLIATVAKLSLTATWYQKWFVHRRLRPEEFAGRIHNVATGRADYPVHTDVLTSPVLERVHRSTGTYLLPQAYSEGCPTHPAYTAGHATVAGACVTVLKWFFDETYVVQDPVETNSAGTAVFEYDGPDLTVGGELNKLAWNIGVGRNMAGIHWLSDATASLRFGEEIAVRFLTDERLCLHEDFTGLNLTRFDGTRVTI